MLKDDPKLHITKNKLLKTQLKKSFGSDHTAYSPEMLKFINLVEQAYDKYEGDLGLLERSMTISNAELTNKNAEIKAKNIKIQKKNQELKDITYVIVHDLKEPARNISTFLNLLKKDLLGSVSEQKKEFVSFILKASQRLDNMLSDLLQYAIIENNESLYKPVNLEEVLSVSKQNLMSKLSSIDYVINQDQLPTLHGYFTHLISLFQNLLSNAIKFRKPNTILVIDIQSQADEDYYTITVSDNGVGSATKTHQKLFSLFQIGHLRTEYDGNGIGLSLCKKIVDNHNAEIWIDSEYTDGFKVVMKFPRTDYS